MNTKIIQKEKHLKQNMFVVLIAVGYFFILGNSSASAFWDSTLWTKYDTITIDHTKVDATLTDFPVYVNLADLSAQFWATTPSSAALVGTDIRVTTSGGSYEELPYELVFASSTTKTGELHFKANTISSTTDTVFRIYYNGTTTPGKYAANSTYGSENVWTSDYLGVWHLGEDGNNTVGGYKDSTANGNDGKGTSMTSSSDVSGRLGTAQSFDGGADFISIVENNAIEPYDHITVSSWFAINTHTSFGGIVSRTYDTSSTESGWGLTTISNGVAALGFHTETTGTAANNSSGCDVYSYLCTTHKVVNNGWHYGVGVYDGTQATVYLNYDEEQQTNTAPEGAIDYVPDNTLYIGRYADNDETHYTDGTIDEVRIASTTRSAAWIKAEYTNQSVATDFYTVRSGSYWNPTDWTKYDTITIDHTKVDATLTDFPVYVNLADLSNSFWASTSSATPGADIRVTTDGGSPIELARELVSASSTTKTGELHFKANTISSTTDTVFRIYYNGSTDADYKATSLYGGQNVWTSDYIAVWHMNEDPSGGTNAIKDSTKNNHNGTSGGSMTTSDLVTGSLGKAINFDGTDDIIAMGTDYNNLTTFNISSWIKPTGWGGGSLGRIIDYGTGASKGFSLYTEGASAPVNNLRFFSDNSGSGYYWDTPASTITLSAYQQVSLNMTDITTVSNDPDIYLGGMLQTEVKGGGTGTYDNPNGEVLYIGNRLAADRTFAGDIDEVRIASTTRSAAWIKAEYTNQSSSTTFYNRAVGVTKYLHITENTGGQVSNAFTSPSASNAELFAFRLSTSTVALNVTSLVVRLEGVQRVSSSNFSSLALYQDVNNNAVYNAGTDVLVSTGVVSLGAGNQSGTVTFSTGFTVAGNKNYVVIGTTSSVPSGGTVTFALRPADISVDTVAASGTISTIQHVRKSSGGGSYFGGGGSVGGDAPAGAGDVGGGSADGGGIVDTNTGGATIGDAPDYNWPTAQSGSWTNGANAYDKVDGTYATAASAVNHSYQNAGFVIPGTNSITGIEVKLELSGTTAAGLVNVQLSWNGGTSWTTAKATPTLTTTDAVRTLGGPADLWGRTWTATELNNTNFAVRVAASPSSNTVRLDAIQIRVYHQSSGGGQGGGGGGGGI